MRFLESRCSSCNYSRRHSTHAHLLHGPRLSRLPHCILHQWHFCGSKDSTVMGTHRNSDDIQGRVRSHCICIRQHLSQQRCRIWDNRRNQRNKRFHSGNRKSTGTGSAWIDLCSDGELFSNIPVRLPLRILLHAMIGNHRIGSFSFWTSRINQREEVVGIISKALATSIVINIIKSSCVCGDTHIMYKQHRIEGFKQIQLEFVLNCRGKHFEVLFYCTGVCAPRVRVARVSM